VIRQRHAEAAGDAAGLERECVVVHPSTDVVQGMMPLSFKSLEEQAPENGFAFQGILKHLKCN